MNIYSIKDRLIGYFMPPFVGPDDNQVKAAIANTVNSGDKTNAFAQAPHQFELWRLATIDEDSVTKNQDFLCDLSSLFRGGVRETTRPENNSATHQTGSTAPTSQGFVSPAHRSTRAQQQTAGPAVAK